MNAKKVENACFCGSPCLQYRREVAHYVKERHIKKLRFYRKSFEGSDRKTAE